MIGAFFLRCFEADGPDLQGRDLSNSQLVGLTKSILLHCALCEISQKARYDNLHVATVYSRF